ncbi:MAG: hypothetical protein RLZZ238_2272, partial [Planctomycetota bacterium]
MHGRSSVRSVALSLFAPVAVSLCAGTASAGDPFEWPASAGGNGHWYQVVGIDFGTRDEARALAQAQGAELVSFGGLAESNFVQARVLAELPIGSEMALGGYQDPSAPGYSEPNGGWRWFDATPWVFSKWDVGICSPTQLQPDDNSGADRLFARICGTQLVWFDDIASRQVAYAIFEWSADCNGDGVIDYGQVFYADADGDGFGFGEPLAPG